MALILNIDTSTKVCSVALHKNGDLISIKESFEANSHSETILKFVEEVFLETDFSKNDLNAIAVSKGPGSYTGLRIGVSSAKGLAYGLNIPLISVDTLKSMASFGILKQKNEKGFYIPMIDARRMEVYCSILDEKLNILNPIEAIVVEKESFDSYLEKGKVFIFGDGSEKLNGTISHPNLVLLNNIYTSAKYMGQFSYENFQTNKFEDLAYFEPYYLKEFMTKPSTKKLL